MKIFIALTYYRPHTSGLTVYTERLAKAFARRGNDVTILTSQYDKSLPRDEIHDGVKIIRAPVWFRVSKGVIMPTIGLLATRLALEADVILLHLPQFDAAGIALRGRLFSKPTILTYHCDLKLPSGVFNTIASYAIHFVNNLAALFSNMIVTNTLDYAEHSSFLLRYKQKLHVIPPPIEVADITEEDKNNFIATVNPEKRYPVIGMVTRFASEKGIEILLKSFSKVLSRFPNASIFFVGQHENVIGEEEYLRRLGPIIQRYENECHWKYLGLLSPTDLSSFYKMIDVLAVPSLNSTESFGMVQIEAMIHGTPVVASDIPGVRQPVLSTGMGKLFEVGNHSALSEALIEVVQNLSKFINSNQDLHKNYSSDNIANEYLKLFHSLKK